MCDHRNLHVRAPSFPTRRSSDLFRNGFSGGLIGAGTRHPALARACLCRFRVRTGSGDGDMSTAELGGIDIRKTQLVVEEIWHERGPVRAHPVRRSEEHTSELQSLMRISYAVFCLQKKNNKSKHI